MQITRLVRPLACSLLLAFIVSGPAAVSWADTHEDHESGAAATPHKPTAQENALIEKVRAVTKRFKNVTSIEGPGEGYELQFGCVSGGEFGAMGLHYVNMGLVDGEVEPSLFHLFEKPNRFGLETFYTLHVWAWKDNPNGPFVNWNPRVSCEGFNDPTFEP